MPNLSVVGENNTPLTQAIAASQSQPIDNSQVNTAQQLLGQSSDTTQNQQPTILDNPVPITQNYGNYNPDLEVFSGGYARDTNFGAKQGDNVKLPPGNWQIVNQNDSASQNGYVGNGENAGYGRAVLAQNLDTGERIHFIHLDTVNTKLGDFMQGGQIIGRVGKSGNATGENLGLEYYNPQGQLSDIMASPYSEYIMPSQ